MRKILLLSFISLITLSCSNDDITDTLNPNDDNETTKTLNEEQKEFMLEYKHVVVDDLNLKWKKEILLFLDGTITEDYKNTVVKEVLETYNGLFSDGIKVTLVNTLSASNVHLYRATKNELANFWPDVYNAAGSSAAGYGSTAWSASSAQAEKVINSGKIWVEISAGKAILAHELGHVLGLGHSTQNYCSTSVMCGAPTVDGLSAFDKAMVRILYHSKIKSGASYEEMKPIIENLLLTNEIKIN